MIQIQQKNKAEIGEVKPRSFCLEEICFFDDNKIVSFVNGKYDKFESNLNSY